MHRLGIETLAFEKWSDRHCGVTNRHEAYSNAPRRVFDARLSGAKIFCGLPRKRQYPVVQSSCQSLHDTGTSQAPRPLY